MRTRPGRICHCRAAPSSNIAVQRRRAAPSSSIAAQYCRPTPSSGTCTYCGPSGLEKRVDIARRDSEPENGILPDHYGGLLAAGGVLTSLEWRFSWSWHHGRRTKRLELAYRRFLPLVLEIPATFEYIDFEGPPHRLQITKFGGYPMGWGSEAGWLADIIAHIMAPFGNGAQMMARSAIDSPINRRCLTLRASFAGSIRPPGPPPQIDVLINCVFRRN